MVTKSIVIMRLSKDVNIDPIEFASQGNAILGIRDSGKSYTATYMAEQLMENQIPIIAFDPIGIWKNLKIGKKGKGFPVVVAGGDDGDIPLTPENADDIVRAAMRENVSLIIDLYSIGLSKNDWKRIVEKCIRLLLYENKDCGLRHIFIEEAAEFCPQKINPGQGAVYAEIEKLARMGGNASLGYTLINQRAEEVNKAVLELCDCLFLHRQKGRHSITALGKWLDVTDTSNAKEVTNSLPSLDQGECWVWMQGSHKPMRLKMPEKRTVHPDRKNPLAVHKGISADVGPFVERMKLLLDKIVKIPVDRRERRSEELNPTHHKRDQEVEDLMNECDNLRSKLQLEQSVRIALENKLSSVREMLAPDFDKMKKIFDEISVNNESVSDDSNIRRIWLPKFSGKAAELLEALIAHRKLDRAKWCKLTGTVYTSSTFDRSVSEFKRLKLISKQGNEFILNDL